MSDTFEKAVEAAADALKAAINTVDGLRGYRGDGLGKVQLPAGVVGLPALTMASYCQTPTSGRFPVALLVSLDDRAMGKLMRLISPVIAALEEAGGSVDNSAGIEPFSLDIGEGMTAAGYEITVNFPFRT